MKILLNGVETNNKGAELMLYSVLQEIERKYPDATVLIPSVNVPQGVDFVKTNLDFRLIPQSFFYRLCRKIHIPGILRRLRLSYVQFTDFRLIQNIDYFIDGSGFAFSDKWNIGEEAYNLWKHRLEGYRRQGTKIIFLPQAFGPADNIWTKKILRLLTDNADIVFPREKISYDYLINSGCAKDKIQVKTDFTSLIEGNVPEVYRHLEGKVAIIPNLRMVDKGTIDKKRYLTLMTDMIALIRKSGHDAYLLNHEGYGDEGLCNEIKDNVGNIEVVTRLNALEVKGLISTSYLCITSRFHGVASALNSCVPCLATSWSHKYEELFKDYGFSDCVINLEDQEDFRNKLLCYLDNDNNQKMREHLKLMKPKIQEQTIDMWNIIWTL